MSSLKDSLAQSIGASAGELALFIDRFKKNRSDSNIEKKITNKIQMSKLLDDKSDEVNREQRLEKSQSELNFTPKKTLSQSFSLNSSLSIEAEVAPTEIDPPSPTIDTSSPLLVEDITPEQPTQIENPKTDETNNYIIPGLILFLSLTLIILKNFSLTFLIYFFGLLSGFLISILIFYIAIKFDLFKNFNLNTKNDKNENSMHNNIQSLLIQTAVKKENKNFDGVYRGWMNELKDNYKPEDYFINKTRSVYVNLDGNLLRLQTTNSRIPKRAVADEKIGQVSFNDLRLYDISECDLSLLPEKLCRKRYWSKKYPICLKNIKLLNKKMEATGEINENCLILFARTDREKEEWFNLFRKASSRNLLNSSHYRKSYELPVDRLVSQEKGAQRDLNVGTQTEESFLYESSLTFMNTFLIRIFADFFYNKHWINQVQTKIQNKLNKIKVPYFMEDLLITGVDLGCVVPLIKQASEPWYDEKGLWVHLDIDYNGSIQMSLATKLNLMKLKSDEGELVNRVGVREAKKFNPAIENSSEEDSPESSGDEYVHSSLDEETKLVETATPSKKFLSIVNKIAASNYFQKAAEMKYVKKAMENVSNCQLLLNVEVKKITGTLALNIPPHPSDRIWYGFVTKPKMDLVATPQVGEKEVSYTAISDLIADKLKLEFQKVLVFPNMDDFYIPILNSEVDKKK
ncbi:unnamed protein product [Brachionus calyciflorus]|uniref:SMP-LTD domain-containing protein n=1 Tax=Brachionus calyciflorus TaxID=104777 RepID=A0A814FVW4_9BILA|nr:unnamed protein product [Brachionus calyciflorus]